MVVRCYTCMLVRWDAQMGVILSVSMAAVLEDELVRVLVVVPVTSELQLMIFPVDWWLPAGVGALEIVAVIIIIVAVLETFQLVQLGATVVLLQHLLVVGGGHKVLVVLVVMSTAIGVMESLARLVLVVLVVLVQVDQVAGEVIMVVVEGVMVEVEGAAATVLII